MHIQIPAFVRRHAVAVVSVLTVLLAQVLCTYILVSEIRSVDPSQYYSDAADAETMREQHSELESLIEEAKNECSDGNETLMELSKQLSLMALERHFR
jgi:hypothetical protein